MEIEFTNEELLNYTTSNYKGKQRISESVLVKFRDKINYIREAENFNELSKIRSLNIEKLKGYYSARINDQWRREFEFIKPNTLRIFKISKHYE